MTVLSYRSYFTVEDGRERVIDKTLGLVGTWLTDQGLEPGDFRSGGLVELAPGVTVQLLRPSRPEVSAIVRVRLVEYAASAPWVTELTVNVPWRVTERPGLRASLLLDIYAPGEDAARQVRVPALVDRLLEGLEARDGSAILLDRPVRVVGADQAEWLAEAVCDDDRRGLLFVAGSSKQLPDMRWYDYVRAVVRHTHGLAACYFMDPIATRALEEILGPAHAVPPGALRAYRPDADPASDLDVLRHQLLTTEQILDSDREKLERSLFVAARDQATGSALPMSMIYADKRLRQYGDESLMATLTKDVPPVPEKLVAPNLTLTSEPSEPLRIEPVIHRVLGLSTEPNVIALEEIQRLALLGLSAQDFGTRVRRELVERQSRIDHLQGELLRTVKRLEDEQLEHYDAYERVRHLERLLAEAGIAEPAPGEAPSGVVVATAVGTGEPRSFAEVLDRVVSLPGVTFTGSMEPVEELAGSDPLGLWAIKAWRIFCALSDYARESVAGRCPTGVDGYLRNLPPGCRGYSVNKHAATESTTTQSVSRFREARRLPVPVGVDSRGKALMYAHFRIARSGRLSPRLHYLDDTARSGQVYVGYIGPHLPNKGTN